MLLKISLLFVSLLSIIIFLNAITLRSATNKIYIGGAIFPHLLKTDESYKKLVEEQLSCVKPENEMKWLNVEKTRGQLNLTEADELVHFAQNSSMKIRGHTLVWHEQVPNWLNGMNASELESVTRKHIIDEVTHFKGKIYAWDVLNEIFEGDGSLRHSIWYKHFNSTFVSDVFKTAHSVDPNAKLYINEYDVQAKNKKSDGLYNLVKKLKSDGIPIHGVGFQSHFKAGKVPTDLETNLKRFADLGLDIALTELDIRIDMPSTDAKIQQQTKDYVYVFKSCLNIPKCVGISFWGITDKYSWIPTKFKTEGDALPFDANYKPKSSVAAIEQVLKEVL